MARHRHPVFAICAQWIAPGVVQCATLRRSQPEGAHVAIQRLVSAAVQSGRVREGEGRGMDDVLAWLFNEGSSSMVGADGDAMSITSLQVRFLSGYRQQVEAWSHNLHDHLRHLCYDDSNPDTTAGGARL